MRRFLAAGAVALAATLAMTGVAFATPSYFLRVEAPGATVDPGTYYAIPDQIAAQRGELASAGNCVRAGGDIPIGGKTALGVVVAAAEASQALQPLLVVEDSFGKRVCRMNAFNETDTPFTGWLFRSNHVAPEMSAELVPIQQTDQILWVFANFGTGANTGDELVLSGPVRSTPGTVQVSVSAVAFDGATHPAPDGTVINGGTGPVVTSGGVATVPVSATTTLRAVGPGAAPTEIPSNELPVCVAAALTDCPAVPGKRIVGTNLRDSFKGGGGPDQIRTRGGNDKVWVRGGGVDRVDCGAGKDVVIAGAEDKMKRCEKTRIRGGGKKGKGKRGK
jgi:Ca2+-binding RTX toxin-like protein